jgi:hypothetical protein
MTFLIEGKYERKRIREGRRRKEKSQESYDRVCLNATNPNPNANPNEYKKRRRGKRKCGALVPNKGRRKPNSNIQQ